MGKLDGKVAVVTGAASGIGRGIALAFAAAASLAGCGKERGKAPAAAAAHQVQAGIVTLQPAHNTVLSAMPGTVVAEQSVQVASRLMGYIKAIAVVEGQTVKAGDILFVIDPRPYQAAVAKAEAKPRPKILSTSIRRYRTIA